MKRTLLITAALCVLPTAAALAAPSGACAVSEPLAVADDPANCFKGNWRGETMPAYRGAEGPVRSEMPMSIGALDRCSISMVLATADDVGSCLKTGGTLR